MNLPKPHVNKTEYEKILNEGFRLFPERRENYELYISSQEKTIEVPYMPIKLDIEVSNICNFRCRMCAMSLNKKVVRAPMTFAEYKRILDDQYGVIEVKLQGFGEPLLNKDFFRIVEETVKKKIWCRTITNGSLLHVDDNYKKIIDYGVNEIQVSIDGATKDTFEKIRVGSEFELVVDNVKKMNFYAKEKGEGWRTSCWMLVQKENYSELEEMLDLAEYMGFTRMVYSMSINNWGEEGLNSYVEENIVDIERDKERLFSLIEDGKRRNIEVTFWDSNDKYIFTDDKDRLCSWLWERINVVTSMDVLPCCEINDAPKYSMGSGINFIKTWNGEKYRTLRKMHLDGIIPEYCRNCYK